MTKLLAREIAETRWWVSIVSDVSRQRPRCLAHQGKKCGLPVDHGACLHQHRCRRNRPVRRHTITRAPPIGGPQGGRNSGGTSTHDGAHAMGVTWEFSGRVRVSGRAPQAVARRITGSLQRFPGLPGHMKVYSKTRRENDDKTSLDAGQNVSFSSSASVFGFGDRRRNTLGRECQADWGHARGRPGSPQSPAHSVIRPGEPRIARGRCDT